jgi:hypothetical protein
MITNKTRPPTNTNKTQQGGVNKHNKTHQGGVDEHEQNKTSYKHQ